MWFEKTLRSALTWKNRREAGIDSIWLRGTTRRNFLGIIPPPLAHPGCCYIEGDGAELQTGILSNLLEMVARADDGQ